MTKPMAPALSVALVLVAVGLTFAEGSNCTTNFSAGAVWPASVGNTTVYQACSSIDQASFQSDLQASRYCSSNGTWGDVDLTTCALLPSTAQSFALVWIVFNVTSVNASSVNVVGNGLRMASLNDSLPITNVILLSSFQPKHWKNHIVVST
ncbi:hypothetical protein EMCRGX_G007021 [Ephydatia muelleri]